MNSFVKLRPAVASSYRRLATVNKESTRKMHIKPIKMWWSTGDNYAYLVTDETTKDSVIIDPAHPKDVLPTLSPLVKSGDVKLTAIMNTHKHHDHSGGNDELLSTLKSTDGKDLPLIAGSGSPRVTRTPKHGESFSFGSVSVKALHTPCHTDESICWHFTDSSSGNEAGKTNNAVFTGDTLFSGGCGRFFEGTPEQMDTALNKTLAALPDDTRIYPGHEYTKSNAKFAVSVSSKPEVKELLDYATTNEVTTGRWTMGEEKKHNVFMMLQDEEIRKKTGTEGKNEATVMGKLREMKNSFRG